MTPNQTRNIRVKSILDSMRTMKKLYSFYVIIVLLVVIKGIRNQQFFFEELFLFMFPPSLICIVTYRRYLESLIKFKYELLGSIQLDEEKIQCPRCGHQNFFRHLQKQTNSKNVQCYIIDCEQCGEVGSLIVSFQSQLGNEV